MGGIVGAAMQSTVNNANVSDANLTANNTIGGIVGSSNMSNIDKGIFDGNILAKKASWDGLAAGGIVGSLDSDWSGSTTAIITNNIANGAIAVAEGEEGDATIHRIVGRTIANEEDCDLTEKRLANNFAIKGMTVNGNAVESDDATTVEGKTASKDELDKAALEALGYAYGDNADAPWKEDGKTMPVLYFENTLMAASHTCKRNASLKRHKGCKCLYAHSRDKGFAREFRQECHYSRCQEQEHESKRIRTFCQGKEGGRKTDENSHNELSTRRRAARHRYPHGV